jgi:hypothetical protein
LSKIKVVFQRKTLVLASGWFATELDKVDPLKPLPKAIEKLIRWFIHNGKSYADGEIKKDIDRGLANLFTDGFIDKFSNEDPLFLIQTEMPPSLGLPAVASLVHTVRRALLRRNARPNNEIDPLEVSVENTRLKSKRKHLGYEQRERLLLGQFPASRNTVMKALKDGQDAIATIEEAKASMPSNHEAFLTLVDFQSKTLQLFVSPKSR